MKKTAAVIAILSFVLSLSFTNYAQAKEVDERIYIVSAGQVDKKIIEEIKEKLPALLPMRVRVVIDEAVAISQDAYEPTRKQYVAQLMIDHVMQHIGIDPTNERALIITDVDLYMPDSDFVFGLADVKKGACIVSLARLQDTDRIIKEAVYELGHSWGLDNCPDPKCVMHFSNSIQDVDNKRDTFCHKCKDLLCERYHKPLIKVKLPTIL